VSKETIKHIAIFASGAGSNAKKIIEFFEGNDFIKIALIACNMHGAGVLEIAKENHIPVLFIAKDKFFKGNAYMDELRKAKIDLIVLAGFLWKIPATLINAYQNKILNIHPALLPKYGGKGMYGEKVHGAVIKSGDDESGITIHLVDEIYDNGKIIYQAFCGVDKNDTIETLAKKIHALEHTHYPKVIAEYIRALNL
jgi:phosphoribosylglycinamide formyltransferase 1